jgi:protein TonB
MDRSRALFPSLSFAAHVTGAAVLAVAPLFAPESLPTAIDWGSAPPRIDDALAVSLGSRPVRAGGDVPKVHVEQPRLPTAPTTIASTLPDVQAVDIFGGGGGVAGVPDGDGTGTGTGDGSGLCLVDCTGGPGFVPPRPLKASEQVAPVRTGGEIREPAKLRHVAPVYPPLAIAAHVQGRVVLDAVVDTQGNVASVKVLKSVPLLDAAAVEAVQQWRYRPTLLNGIPVSVLLTVTVEFRLR